MRLREAGWSDVWRIRRWRNHPAVRPWMRNTGHIGWFGHLRWYRRTLRRDDVQLLIIMVRGQPVGYGRLDFSNHRVVYGRRVRMSERVPQQVMEAEVGVVIDPRHQGKGAGTRAIELLAMAARAQGAELVAAEVKRHNAASRRAFQKAGFVLQKYGSGYAFMEWRPGEDVAAIEASVGLR